MVTNRGVRCVLYNSMLTPDDPFYEGSRIPMSTFLARWSPALLLAVLLFTTSGCGAPPQVVDDEDCFAAVDALWTAVTSKRIDLVEQTATELDRLFDQGLLSSEGHAALEAIIEQARSEQWQNSAYTLKAFMLGQRKTRSNQ